MDKTINGQEKLKHQNCTSNGGTKASTQHEESTSLISTQHEESKSLNSTGGTKTPGKDMSLSVSAFFVSISESIPHRYGAVLRTSGEHYRASRAAAVESSILVLEVHAVDAVSMVADDVGAGMIA